MIEFSPQCFSAYKVSRVQFVVFYLMYTISISL
jgi:hypothetical protein